MADPVEHQEDGFETRSHTPEQVSLFSPDELVIPDSVYQLKKGISAIHSYPVKGGSHTTNSQKLFNGIILAAQLNMRERRDVTMDDVREKRISPIIEVRVTDLAELSGLPEKHTKSIYDDLRMLFEMTMQWNIVGEDSTVLWNMQSHFLSSLGIGQGGKRGAIRFSFDPEVLCLLVEPSNWAMLSMQVLRSLHLKAAHSLYQQSFRYVTTDRKITAQLPLETWVKLLIGPSRYIKEGENGQPVVNYKDFKRYVLVPAMDEVNSHPALRYELALIEKKVGNRVAALQFRFVHKKQDALELPLAWDEKTFSLLADLGLTQQEVSDLAQAHSQAAVIEALSRLPKAEAALRSKGKAVNSRKAYFLGILSRIHTNFEPEKDAQAISDEVEAQVAKQQADQRRKKVEEDFAAHQAETYRRNFLMLPEDEKQTLIERFAASEEGQRSTTKRFLGKGWAVGNTALFALLRNWAKTHQPDLEDRLLPLPQDRSFEAWRDWKLVG